MSVMGSDACGSYARRVRRARALARDPTTARDALRAFCASDASAVGAVATLATAGASGCGKTALVRRFFAESRRRRGCANADASEDRRATRTIGMDFGVMSCALERSDGDEDGGEARAPARARGRFFDPSGAAAHAACRAAAYRRADGVVYVLDQTLGDVDARAIERGLREIVDARRGETRGVVRVLFATRRRSGVDRIDAATTVDRRARKPRPTPRDDQFALLRDVKAACAAVLTTNPLDVAFVLVEPPRGASLARALDSLRHLTLVEVDARAGTGVVDAFHALFAVARRE